MWNKLTSNNILLLVSLALPLIMYVFAEAGNMTAATVLLAAYTLIMAVVVLKK